MNEDHKAEIIRAVTNNIFNTLKTQDFRDWYIKGDWNDFITGDLEHRMKIGYLIAETLIKQGIQKRFNIT